MSVAFLDGEPPPGMPTVRRPTPKPEAPKRKPHPKSKRKSNKQAPRKSG